ncbi:hypothetical protein H4Q32_006909 [Labeo rohita]|uniref:Uncharacterized protein n=1 Tax=Labeo rohita TaxID=84645 RepID=A0ABQ8MEN0_LABRO|nr:hypothetical protein H4Q32_006909 [Labeo rohita]
MLMCYHTGTTIHQVYLIYIFFFKSQLTGSKVGSGKVLGSGFEHGTPGALYVGAQFTRLSAPIRSNY